MKFSSIITTAIITASSTNNVDAFSLQRTNIMAIHKASSALGRPSSFSNSKMFLLAEDTNNEEGEEIASMIGSDNENSLGSVYDRLGFAEENIAMGIDPDKVSGFHFIFIFNVYFRQDGLTFYHHVYLHLLSIEI